MRTLATWLLDLLAPFVGRSLDDIDFNPEDDR